LVLFATLIFASAQTTLASILRFGWDPSSDPNITGYNVSYGTTSGLYTQNLDTGSSTSATVTSLTPSTTYYFIVTAYNSIGLPSLPSNEIAITTPPNIPPTVTLTSPSAGQTFSQSPTINLSATASDSDGSVTRVEFYQDANLIGQATSSPYSAVWGNAPSGNFVITALAYDDSGAAVRSTGASISVGTGGVVGPTPTPTPANKVRIASMTPLIKAGDTAKFRITASEVNMSQPIQVNYSLGGTATGGLDYSMAGMTGQVTIPAGERGVMLPMATLSNPSRGRKTAIVTLMPGTGYIPGRATAAVRILSH
jgi:hypothetical protein